MDGYTDLDEPEVPDVEAELPVGLYDELVEAKAELDAAKKRYDDVRALAIEATNANAEDRRTTYGTVNGSRFVRINRITTWRTDTKRLRADYPDIAHAYVKPTVSTHLGLVQR